MKKYLAIPILMLAFTFGEQVYAQHKETRNVSTFTRLSFGVPGKLHLRQGATQKVVLEGDAETLEKIETDVSGSKLVIRTQDKWWNWGGFNKDRINVYVTVKDLDALHVSGSGDVIGENTFSVKDLDLKVSGSGNMNIEVQASGDIEADVSGSGDIVLKGKCHNLSSNISGSGKVRLAVTVADYAYFGMSGSGKVQASGSARKVKTSISGSGHLSAIDFETVTCDVRIAGSGSVEISVKEELDANISGSGSVAYRGNPGKVNSHSSGSGKVRKI